MLVFLLLLESRSCKELQVSFWWYMGGAEIRDYRKSVAGCGVVDITGG